jgi:hypothetical protein
MVKRPFTIILISLIYLFSPVFVILQAAVVNRVPVVGYHSVFSLLLVSDIVVLCLYLVCAVSVFLVKKWGWYAFICSSVYLITYNFISLAINPHNSFLLMIGYDLILTMIAFVFFRKNLIAPFFNPKLRWWETEPRYMIGIFLEIKIAGKIVRAEIADLSESGCFIIHTEGPEVGKSYNGVVSCMGVLVSVVAWVVRKSKHGDAEHGYGIAFTAMDKMGKHGLDRIIAKLRMTKLIKSKRCPPESLEKCINAAPRYMVRTMLSIKNESGDIECALLNLSKNGCLIQSDKNLSLDISYLLDLSCAGLGTRVNSVVRWKIESGSNGIKEYGIHFLDLHRIAKKEISRIIGCFAGIGATNRLKTAKPVDEDVIDSCVANTPYRIILILKKLIFGQR